MFSKFFIERPVLANVIAILFMLLGGVAIFRCLSRNIRPSRRPLFRSPQTIPGPVPGR